MKDRQERGIQFNLRSIMYVTTLFAFFCAVFAPFLRGFDTEQQLALVVVGLVEAICFVGGMIYIKLRREHTLGLAGKRDFRTSFYERRQSSFRRDMIVGLKLLAILAMQIGISVYLYVMIRTGILAQVKRENVEFLFAIVVQLAFLSQVAPSLVWSMIWGIDEQDIEIAERGMIRRGLRFIPWQQFNDVRTSNYFDDAIVMVFGVVAENMSGQTTKTAIVHTEHRDEVVERIQKKIAE